MTLRTALWTALLATLAAAGCENPISFQQMEDAAASRSPMTGKLAPDFTLLNQDEQPVALGKRAGEWTVLYFYPKDDTPGCTCQATEFTHLLKEFRLLGAEVYGISADSPASHRNFQSKLNLELELLSDPKYEVMEKYGAWAQVAAGDGQHVGRIIRSTFIISPDRKIAYHCGEVIPRGHAKRISDKLKALQAGKPAIVPPGEAKPAKP